MQLSHRCMAQEIVIWFGFHPDCWINNKHQYENIFLSLLLQDIIASASKKNETEKIITMVNVNNFYKNMLCRSIIDEKEAYNLYRKHKIYLRISKSTDLQLLNQQLDLACRLIKMCQMEYGFIPNKLKIAALKLSSMINRQSFQF